MKNTVNNTTKANNVKTAIITARQQENEKILAMSPQERVQYLRAKTKKISTPKVTAKPQPQQTETDSTEKQVKAIEKEYKNSFTDLMRKYETLALARHNEQPYNEKEYEHISYALAKALTFSVLKKCIDVSQSPTLKATRNSIIIDEKALIDIDYINATNYEYTYNSNGEYIVKVIDSKAENDLYKLVNTNLGSGLDLVHSAYIILLDETAKAIERAKETNTVFTLETPYTQRILKKKVYIQSADSVDGWTDEQTTPIQQVFKAIRREIQASQSVKVPQNGYSYIPSIITDKATDSTETIYKRLPKYINIGSSEYNTNGKETAYTVSDTDFAEYENILETLNLTARQTQVLLLRLAGYGYKSIATYLGIGKTTVTRTMDRIKATATNKGFTIQLPMEKQEPQQEYKTYIQPIVFYGLIDNLCNEYFKKQSEKMKQKNK